ncbi:hypothetical protein EGR_10784 [Echinococcus granulosus]|uniref:Uncharacterized protein n=1 Tax=Echinococcus granulosus TaxID=6210 RepID=W6U7L8_ECHGR|nr:hypothetical protein EGR_10784 [Echinococcus granulosus]EUB54362.1 hypothetical protein EGR_10784 [Echinococcus granulosus]
MIVKSFFRPHFDNLDSDEVGGLTKHPFSVNKDEDIDAAQMHHEFFSVSARR